MRSLAQKIVIVGLLFVLVSTSPLEHQLKPFELWSSILGVLLWLVCLAIFVKQRTKVKYV